MTAQQITGKIEALKVQKNRLIENCSDTTINQREIYRAQISEIEKQIDVLVTERLNASDDEPQPTHGNTLCERCHVAHIFYADSERFCQSCLLAIEIDADNMSEQTTFTVGQTVRSLWLGDEGVVTGFDDGLIVVVYGKNTVFHFAHEIEAIETPVNETVENGGLKGQIIDTQYGELMVTGVKQPVNEGVASLKDFDDEAPEVDSLSDFGAVNWEQNARDLAKLRDQLYRALEIQTDENIRLSHELANMNAELQAVKDSNKVLRHRIYVLKTALNDVYELSDDRSLEMQTIAFEALEKDNASK